MRQKSIRTKLYFTVIAFFLTVLIIWAVFFGYTISAFARNAENNAVQTAGHVIGVLEEQFLELERISFLLSQSDAVRDFAAEEDPLAYHEKADGISALLSGMREDADFVEHLIVFSARDVYYRFRGGMSNTAAAKVFYSTSPTRQPRELALTLEGMQYVGCTIGVYRDAESPLGVIVMLIEEGRLQQLFGSYCADDALQISLAAGGKVITSTESGLIGLPTDAVTAQASFANSRTVGFTPFEILVITNDSYIQSGIRAFALTAAATAVIFAALLLFFARVLDRSFFSPLFDIMQGVERLGSGAESALPAYREESFHRLAGKINDMLRRLDERNKTIFETERKLQQTEISRQKAIIVSLKKQISAHFTVNVLSVIKRLAELGEMQKTIEMCDGLSHLLRYANAGDEFIGGLEEFFVLQKYVDIMQIRYPGQFEAQFDPDERLGDVRIPRMLLQPLIENAILHGLQKGASGGRLSVSAQMSGNRLTIVVRDNGAGMDAACLNEVRARIAEAGALDSLSQGLEHIALVNIQRRVCSYYGADSGVWIESKQGEGTVASLVLDGVAIV